MTQKAKNTPILTKAGVVILIISLIASLVCSISGIVVFFDDNDSSKTRVTLYEQSHNRVSLDTYSVERLCFTPSFSSNQYIIEIDVPIISIADSNGFYVEYTGTSKEFGYNYAYQIRETIYKGEELYIRVQTAGNSYVGYYIYSAPFVPYD